MYKMVQAKHQKAKNEKKITIWKPDTKKSGIQMSPVVECMVYG